MLKRLFDILFSVTILLIFLPVGIIISICILVESRGGIFYRQTRVGRFGKDFRIFKFRTMKPNADQLGKLTVGMRDPRITRVGVFIRKYKLDEFPQFLNVIYGEMSIVGPRPEVREYVDLYTTEQQKILTVKPGITDYASIEYFDENKILGNAVDPKETYIHEIMPAKLALNQKYIQNPTISHDLKIIWLTFRKVVGR
jgi:lipopolysaccharide/colanic/teichoic acid biosynthesis glycosyltransferase